jgi:predicted nucleic acid-binding protein
MSGNRQFVDTNVLVYAYDVTAGEKHSLARVLMEELWTAREGCLSVQVLQEFFVTTTRKISKPLDAPEAARIIGDLAHWHVHAPAAGDVLAAIEIHQRTRASFWDAMFLRSAKELGCGTLHSEDLTPVRHTRASGSATRSWPSRQGSLASHSCLRAAPEPARMARTVAVITSADAATMWLRAYLVKRRHRRRQPAGQA